MRFLPGNLMADLPQLPLFDVIFLRNVLIYFDNEAKSQIVLRVLQQLKPDGVLYTGHGIRIGNSVAIAANCTFAPVNHAYKDAGRLIREQGFLPGKGGIVIEDDVWIGANCVLLDGAILRKGCVVAAGTLVKGELDAFTVYAGNPARAIGKRT